MSRLLAFLTDQLQLHAFQSASCEAHSSIPQHMFVVKTQSLHRGAFTANMRPSKHTASQHRDAPFTLLHTETAKKTCLHTHALSAHARWKVGQELHMNIISSVVLMPQLCYFLPMTMSTMGTRPLLPFYKLACKPCLQALWLAVSSFLCIKIQ
jgi:hypothetical protein